MAKKVKEIEKEVVPESKDEIKIMTDNEGHRWKVNATTGKWLEMV